MIKNRFGGLFSVLSRQDMNTLYHFEAWATDEDLSPDPEFVSEDGYEVQNFPNMPLNEVLAVVKNWTEGLASYCQSYQKGLDQEFPPEVLEAAYEVGDYSKDPVGNPGRFDLISICYKWVHKLRPIIKKLEKAIYKLQNEELDYSSSFSNPEEPRNPKGTMKRYIEGLERGERPTKPPGFR